MNKYEIFLLQLMKMEKKNPTGDDGAVASWLHDVSAQRCLFVRRGAPHVTQPSTVVMETHTSMSVGKTGPRGTPRLHTSDRGSNLVFTFSECDHIRPNAFVFLRVFQLHKHSFTRVCVWFDLLLRCVRARLVKERHLASLAGLVRSVLIGS